MFIAHSKKFFVLRGNGTVVGWKLGASFEIFVSKKKKFSNVRLKACIVHILV